MAERGIVHRNISPQTSSSDGGAVKITDFGAAQHVAEKDPPVLLENADHGAWQGIEDLVLAGEVQVQQRRARHCDLLRELLLPEQVLSQDVEWASDV